MSSNTLTQEQKKIVLSSIKIKQIVAGAGCGKTFTIIEAITHYFTKGLKAEKLMLITFTRKAASEMKERLQKKLLESNSNIDLSKAKIGTFHSVCFAMLKKYFPATIRNAEIMDEEKSKNVHYSISEKYKEKLLGLPLDVLFKSEDLKPELVKIKKQIEKEYNSHKKLHNLLDFDDIIYTFLDAAKKSKKLSTIQKDFSLVVVDEFQDSGKLEMEFLKILKPKRLMVVGDDWQSIYSFRRADLEYTKNFRKYFSGSKQFFLTCNYRSTTNIISVSAQSIRKCKGLISKKIKAYNKLGPRPVLVLFQKNQLLEESIKEISLWLSKNPSGHTALLSRTNRQSDLMKKIFLKSYRPTPSKNDNDKKNKIEFMTIHQAKGLEFDNVIIAPIDSKSIPHPDGKVEEEMRLLYVACSRAKKNLLMLAAHSKNPSPFLSFFRRSLKKFYLLDTGKIKKTLEKDWGISSAG